MPPPPPCRFTIALTAVLLLLLLVPRASQSNRPHHVIRFRSPNLRPSSVAYDPFAQHFLVSSLSSPTIHSVSDAGVTQQLLSLASSSPSAATFALSIDSNRRRLLAIVLDSSSSSSSSLAAFSLPSLRTLFLCPFPSSLSSPGATVADFYGNTFVTDSRAGLIYQVTESGGTPSLFSNSSNFGSSGLDGLAYISKGYLLVVQSSTGRIYKVNEHNGAVRQVLLNRDLPGAQGIAIRGDGTAVVASAERVWYLKSEDSWAEGVVYDEVSLEEGRVVRDVVVGRDDRVYVLLYREGRGDAAAAAAEEWFEIEEVRSKREVEEEEGGGVWVYVLVLFGMVYFLIWRFQMRQLASNMNKKTN